MLIHNKIAVVVPVYSAEKILDELCSRLTFNLSQITDSFEIILVDDGSTDGTSQYIKENFPKIKLIQGDGSLYWGGGMYLAWEEALKKEQNFDYFLWVNDDVIFFEDGIYTLLNTTINKDSLVVGSFCDSISKKTTYGGVVSIKKTLSPFGLRLVEVNGYSQEVDGINGNGVLIPYLAFKQIGKFDKQFIHAGGDLDYALRARKKNIKIFYKKFKKNNHL